MGDGLRKRQKDEVRRETTNVNEKKWEQNDEKCAWKMKGEKIKVNGRVVSEEKRKDTDR